MLLRNQVYVNKYDDSRKGKKNFKFLNARGTLLKNRSFSVRSTKLFEIYSKPHF